MTRYNSYSLPEEPKTGIISRLELQQGMTATDQLESQGQASSASYNCSKELQPLTFWRAKDRHYQQARIVARYHIHSLPEEQGKTLSAS
jgi:hypothetical protein